MNTDFETEAELEFQHLPNGLLVITKGQTAFNDKLGKTFLVEATGTGITLASGNIAVPQPSASVNAADIAAQAILIQANTDAIAAQALLIQANTDALTGKYDKTGGPLTGAATGPDFTAT